MLGFRRGLKPIIDGNVTVVIVAVMLMGAFGPTDGIFAKLLRPVFFAFGASTAGTIYSFGYTLLVGVLLNFVFGVGCTRVMLRGISKLKCMRSAVLYGGLRPQAQLKKGKNVEHCGGRAKSSLHFSLCLVLFIAVFSAVFGVKMDIQFKGGAMISYSYEGEAPVADLTKRGQGRLGQ